MPPFRILLSPEMMSNQMALEIHNAIVGFGCSYEFVIVSLMGLLALAIWKGIRTQSEKEALQDRIQDLEQSGLCSNPDTYQLRKVSAL